MARLKRRGRQPFPRLSLADDLVDDPPGIVVYCPGQKDYLLPCAEEKLPVCKGMTRLGPITEARMWEWPLPSPHLWLWAYFRYPLALSSPGRPSYPRHEAGLVLDGGDRPRGAGGETTTIPAESPVLSMMAATFPVSSVISPFPRV